MVGLIVCIAIYYFKDLSLALGQVDRISLSLATWMPIVAIGLFSSIGILQINENKTYIVLFLISIFFNKQLFGENLKIESSNISIDKKTQTTVFENNVIAYDDKK